MGDLNFNIGGPSDQAKQNVRITVRDSRGQSDSDMPSSSSQDALQIWREKLAFLERELAIESQAVVRFELEQRIREARETIRLLGG
jgi:hypothetical protein